VLGRPNRCIDDSRQAGDRKSMKRDRSVLLALAFVGGMSVTAMAASVGGTVASPQGQPLTGVQVIVKDASGHVVGQGAPGSGGVYDIQGLQPGNYNFTLDPGSSGYQGQTVASYVGADGICLNWGVSTTSPAVASAQPGATCQLAAGGYDTAEIVGAGAGVLGAGAIGLGVGLGSGGDHNTHKTPPSTGQ
jgi:Carboxypeptidase regulatory-like domain